MRRALASPMAAISSKIAAAIRGDALSASIRIARRWERSSSLAISLLSLFFLTSCFEHNRHAQRLAVRANVGSNDGMADGTLDGCNSLPAPGTRHQATADCP